MLQSCCCRMVVLVGLLVALVLVALVLVVLVLIVLVLVVFSCFRSCSCCFL